MNEDLRRTPWNRLSVRLRVPRSTGVYLVGAGAGRSPAEVMLVGSARNLRSAILDLLEREDLHVARAVHWVADLTVEQARLAERLFVRRYNPPMSAAPRTRYLDILAG